VTDSSFELAPPSRQGHKQDGEFVAFRFEILPRPK
jgi:hypothetical protein